MKIQLYLPSKQKHVPVIGSHWDFSGSTPLGLQLQGKH